jgi:hypothetical protein
MVEEVAVMINIKSIKLGQSRVWPRPINNSNKFIHRYHNKWDKEDRPQRLTLLKEVWGDLLIILVAHTIINKEIVLALLIIVLSASLTGTIHKS